MVVVAGGDSVVEVAGGDSVEAVPNSHVHTAACVVVVDIVCGTVVVDPIVVTGSVVVAWARHSPSDSHVSPAVVQQNLPLLG